MMALDLLTHHGPITGYNEVRKKLRRTKKHIELLEGAEIIHNGKRYALATIVTTKRIEPTVLVQVNKEKLS